MTPDTLDVQEQGFHLSPTSPHNTKGTTDGEAAPSSTTSWWRRHKRNKISLAVTVMVVCIALSVGVVLSSIGNKDVKQEANPVAASGGGDDTTIIPERSSSGDHRIIEECNVVQELEAPHVDASSAKVAIDGKNLVVVSRGAAHAQNSGIRIFPSWYNPNEYSVYVEFYSLTGNGWEKVIEFKENDILDFKWEYGQRNVALSGKIAVVTFPSDDGFDRPVYTYRQNNDGLWNKVLLAFPESGGQCLRGTADVDEDLMVTFDETYCGYCSKPNYVSIYKRSGGAWTKAGTIDVLEEHNTAGVNLYAYQIALSGDTIAVQVIDRDPSCFDDVIPAPDQAIAAECFVKIYTYNRESGTVTFQQDLIGSESKCSHMVFDGEYLVHGLSVYHRQGIGNDEPFSLLKTVHYPSPVSGMVPTGYGKSLALDDGILVVGSDEGAFIFDLQNDHITEQELKLDQKPNDAYEISDGMLVASDQDVFGVTILDCKQPVPATDSPTSYPTYSMTSLGGGIEKTWSPTPASTSVGTPSMPPNLNPSSYPTYSMTSLGGGIEKTWSPTPASTSVGTPSMPPNLNPSTLTYCSSEEECKENHDGSFSQFVSGNYQNYGCFSKGGTLYWGIGGTSEQEMDDSDFLNGVKERVYCVWTTGV
jgi:hypothetical protein